MNKDEILRVRVDSETVEKLKEVGNKLEQLNPGLDYSLSNLVRAAINNFIEPPKKDPQVVEFRLPDNLRDGDLVEFWNALAAAESKAKRKGVAELFEAITDSLAMRYVLALKTGLKAPEEPEKQ